MGIIRDYIEKMRERKRQKEQYAEQQQMVQGFQAKQMNSNERELLRYQEEDRQRQIKAALEARKKADNEKIWSGQYANPAFAPNVIQGQKNLFNGGNMFAHTQDAVHNQDVVKCKNLFHNPQNIFGGKKK